jgi:hypothetical protein
MISVTEFRHHRCSWIAERLDSHQRVRLGHRVLGGYAGTGITALSGS